MHLTFHTRFWGLNSPPKVRKLEAVVGPRPQERGWHERNRNRREMSLARVARAQGSRSRKE